MAERKSMGSNKMMCMSKTGTETEITPSYFLVRRLKYFIVSYLLQRNDNCICIHILICIYLN